MFSFIKNLFVPQQHNYIMQAAKELHDARLDLLNAQKEQEYWKAMEVMLRERIARLESYPKVDWD